MLHCIIKTIIDYCLKLYTLLSYINLKICIFFGDDSKCYFRIFEFFVKKMFFTSCAVSQKLYDYCIKLLHKTKGVSCAHGAAVY